MPTATTWSCSASDFLDSAVPGPAAAQLTLPARPTTIKMGPNHPPARCFFPFSGDCAYVSLRHFRSQRRLLSRPDRQIPGRRRRDRNHGQRLSRHLYRAPRPHRAHRRGLCQRRRPALGGTQYRAVGRPRNQPVPSAARCPTAQRVARQCGHPAQRHGRHLSDDSQILQGAAHARRSDSPGQLVRRSPRVFADRGAAAQEHHHLGRHRHR